MAGTGLITDWDFINGNVNQFALTFIGPAGAAAAAICAADPICVGAVMAGGFVIYLMARHLPEVIDGIKSATSTDNGGGGLRTRVGTGV